MIRCLLIIWVSIAAFAQTPGGKLAPLAGSWSGVYRFVDGITDTTISQRELSWIVTANDSGLTIEQSLDKLFGLMSDNQVRVLAVSADSRKMYLDGKWWHISDVRETINGTTILFEGQSTDNDRPAHVRNALYMGHTDSLTLTRYVTYDGSAREFIRHQYRLGRAKE